MPYTVFTTRSFDKNLEKMKKRGLSMEAFYEVVRLLMSDGCLPSRFKPHNYQGDTKVNGNVILCQIGF